MTIILDASALLAALLGEPGKERVDEVISGATMTTVNLAEVVGYFAKLGADRTEISALMEGLPIIDVEPDRDLAIEAGLMRPAGEKVGLSLGDRICLAQARRAGATALTADRAWAAIGKSFGIDVELIR
jgi:ribonuclease VapC